MSRHSISRRIFRQIILFSLVFALLAAFLQFQVEYGVKQAAVEKMLASIEAADEAGLATSVWSYDQTQLDALVKGILHFQYVSRVRVSDTEQVLVEASIPGAHAEDPVRVTSLSHRQSGTDVAIGQLEISIDSAEIFADVMAQVLTAIGFQMVLIVLIASAVFLLFRRQATRYLTMLADYLVDFSMVSAQVLSLPGKRDRGDEIDMLVRSFNELHDRLLAANQEQNTALDLLHASETRYRSLVEQAPDAIMVLSADAGRILEANRNAERLFGYPREVLLSMGLTQLYDPVQPDGLPLDESVLRNQSELVENRAMLIFRRIRTADGAVLDCEVRLSRLGAADGNLIRVSYLDISARVHAEDQIRISLQEKEILLQEVYHRTKNNMQVIAALLEMKAMLMPGGSAAPVLKEMVQRIRAMALVHQKLYQSRDLSRIRLKDYLEDLTALLAESMDTTGNEISIRLSVAEDFELLIDTAVPLGLVVNELVVNACKYAFAAGRPGVITIDVRRHDGDILELVLADDGVGLPAGFSLEANAGMGLRTVRSLIEDQLQGSVALEASSGTVWRLRFNHRLYRSRI